MAVVPCLMQPEYKIICVCEFEVEVPSESRTDYSDLTQPNKSVSCRDDKTPLGADSSDSDKYFAISNFRSP
jgi:hypothetical protein